MEKGKPESQKNSELAFTFHVSRFTFHVSLYPFNFLSLNISIFSVLSLLFVVGVLAQEAIRIQSHQFDRNDITVGDAVQLRLLIEADEGLHLYLEPMVLSHLQHVEIEPPKVKRVKPHEAGLEGPVANKAFYEVIYSLRAFAPGKHTLPPITIKSTDADGNEATIQTPAYSFEVRAVTPPPPAGGYADATEIKGIKPPLPPPRGPLVYILMTLLLLTIIGALILLYLRKLSRAKYLPLEVPTLRPPHEIAQERLKQIEAMNLVAQGKMKDYHTEISHVIRQYIEARYNISALELTTEDLLERLGHAAIEAVNLSLIRNFLVHCNLVKFAKYQPSKPQAHERMDEACRMIDATKQVVPRVVTNEASTP